MIYFLLSLSQAQEILISGYGEIRALYTEQKGQSWQSTQRLRPRLKGSFSDEIHFQITPQLLLQQGRYPFGEYIQLLNAPIQEEFGRSIDEIIDDCDWKIETSREINELSDIASLPRFFLDIHHFFVPFRFLCAARQHSKRLKTQKC